MSITLNTFSDFAHHIISSTKISDRMEWCYFLGCTMIAFCAPLALLCFIIAPKPQLIVLSISRYKIYTIYESISLHSKLTIICIVKIVRFSI